MSIYNTPLEERFGEKLEELREGKNMTREQLADQVGLTTRHIAAKRPIPALYRFFIQSLPFGSPAVPGRVK